MDVVTLGMANAAARKVAKTIRPASGRVVAIGDSITFNNSGGHYQQMVVRSNGRATQGGWFATQGLTIEQIRDTHLPQVLALTGAQKPAACMVLAGTNNVGASSGTGFNFPTARTAYLQITTALIGAGILPIICTLPPRADFTLSKTNGQLFNGWLKGIAAANGWPLLNYHALLADGIGGWKSGQSADGIHPNLLGFRTMSEALVPAFAAIFPLGGILPSGHAYDEPNLLPGSAECFQLDSNADGLSDGWANYGGAGTVASRVTTDTTIVGAWQCLERPLAGSGNAYLQLNPGVVTGFAVGDRIAALHYVKATDMETALNQSASTSMNFRISGTVLSTVYPLNAWASDLTSVGVAYAEGVVPATCNSIDLGLSLNNAPSTSQGGKLWVAHPTILNLTALGLA